MIEEFNDSVTYQKGKIVKRVVNSKTGFFHGMRIGSPKKLAKTLKDAGALPKGGYIVAPINKLGERISGEELKEYIQDFLEKEENKDFTVQDLLEHLFAKDSRESGKRVG